MNRSLRDLLAMAIALILVGCASHPKRVDCDGHLKPINAPAPAKPTSAHP
jgi:starvation-inducible outer membrane lipoprotein